MDIALPPALPFLALLLLLRLLAVALEVGAEVMLPLVAATGAKAFVFGLKLRV